MRDGRKRRPGENATERRYEKLVVDDTPKIQSITARKRGGITGAIRNAFEQRLTRIESVTMSGAEMR